MKLGDKLQLLRKVKKLSAKDLATAIGAKEKDILKWENNQAEPTYVFMKEITKVFDNISMDYLNSDEIVNDADRLTQNKIMEFERSQLVEKETSNIINECRNFLLAAGVQVDESILPYPEGESINWNCFKKTSSGYQLIHTKLLEKRAVEVIKHFFADEVSVNEAVLLDDVEILEKGLEIRKGFEEKRKLIKDGSQTAEMIDQYLVQNDLNYVLENLNPKMNQFFGFVKTLIENGAYYTRKDELGEYKDVSKTNFYYKVAITLAK